MVDTIIKKFDGPYDFLQWATNAPCLWKGNLKESRQVSSEKTAWTGTASYEEAYELAAHGWPEGLKLLTDKVNVAEALMANRMAPRAVKKRYDVAGYYPNASRAAAGEILNMVIPQRPKLPTGPIINIRYDFCRSYGVSVNTIMTLGSAICSYINALEKLGYSVNLETVCEFVVGHGNGPDLSFQFPLKKAGQHLSMADMVFWIAHPSALRRIAFSAEERLDIEQWYHSNYGGPVRKVTQEPPGTLYLRIDDARDDVASCIEAIKQKHIALLPGLHAQPDQAAKLAL